MSVSLRQKWLNKTANYMFPLMLSGAFSQALAEEPVVLAMLSPTDDGFVQYDGDFAKRSNLTRALQPLGVNNTDIYYLSRAMKKVFDPSDIRSDMKYSVSFDGVGLDTPPRLVSMRLHLDEVDYVDVTRRDGTKYFDAIAGSYETQTHVAYQEFDITSSLYQDAVDAGVPLYQIHEAIRLLSWDVDFQRDIHPDNKLKLYYSVEVLGDKALRDRGDVLYFDLSYGMNNEKHITAYRYEQDNGQVAYYRDNGESIQNGVLKTPVDGARISSGFDLSRLHPIYKKKRPHRAVDFAAPTGTPIQAAGNGLVIDTGYNAACGKRVVILHSSKIQYEEPNGRISEFDSWTTESCHLSRRATGLDVGDRVSQGDVIGYVGTSGAATGPHLHLVIRKPTGTDTTITSSDWEKQYPGYYPIDWQRVTGDVVSLVPDDQRDQFFAHVDETNRQIGLVSNAHKTLLALERLDEEARYVPVEAPAPLFKDACDYAPVTGYEFLKTAPFDNPVQTACLLPKTFTPLN